MKTVALLILVAFMQSVWSEPLQPGVKAPDFLSKDPSGKDVHLADFKNKILVLDFWATWCGPCIASMPHTQEVAKKFKDQDVVVLAVCTSDTRANFSQFLRARGSSYSNISFTCDPNERGSATYADRAAGKLFGVDGIPTQFVIGKDGKIVATLVGYDKGDDRLEKALAKLGMK